MSFWTFDFMLQVQNYFGSDSCIFLGFSWDCLEGTQSIVKFRADTSSDSQLSQMAKNPPAALFPLFTTTNLRDEWLKI